MQHFLPQDGASHELTTKVLPPCQLDDESSQFSAPCLVTSLKKKRHAYQSYLKDVRTYMQSPGLCLQRITVPLVSDVPPPSQLDHQSCLGLLPIQPHSLTLLGCKATGQRLWHKTSESRPLFKRQPSLVLTKLDKLQDCSCFDCLSLSLTCCSSSLKSKHKLPERQTTDRQTDRPSSCCHSLFLHFPRESCVRRLGTIRSLPHLHCLVHDYGAA